ncbi:Hypothetical protein NTJ_02927 [Nesidiocoris tenuis]|uniref:Uncharacterized protein n=1 Tax=Nesidiocoris tenuis TaxID=355587 RepID=A0ABN7AGX3_9HEMI|nr:Hypothetical protein NTJ_02927 [Nesidiocoris tenuis]
MLICRRRLNNPKQSTIEMISEIVPTGLECSNGGHVSMAGGHMRRNIIATETDQEIVRVGTRYPYPATYQLNWMKDRQRLPTVVDSLRYVAWLAIIWNPPPGRQPSSRPGGVSL